MSCISTTAKARYLAKITKYEARLALAEDYFDYLMGTDGATSFKFDSGEAMVWAQYTDPAKFQTEVIGALETWIEYYRDKYYGKGIVKLDLVRGR